MFSWCEDDFVIENVSREFIHETLEYQKRLDDQMLSTDISSTINSLICILCTLRMHDQTWNSRIQMHMNFNKLFVRKCWGEWSMIPYTMKFLMYPIKDLKKNSILVQKPIHRCEANVFSGARTYKMHKLWIKFAIHEFKSVRKRR